MEKIESTKAAISEFYAEAAGLKGLDYDINLFEKGIVNSLFAIQLVTYIEKKFSIKVEMEDLDMKNFSSITATAEFVHRKKGSHARN